MARQDWRGHNNPEPIRFRVHAEMPFFYLSCWNLFSEENHCAFKIVHDESWIRCMWIRVPYNHEAACAPRLELILVRQIDIYSYINQSLLYKLQKYELHVDLLSLCICYHKISQHSILVHVPPDCTTLTTCKNCNLDLQQKQTWKVCSKGRRVWKVIIRYLIYGSSGLSSFVTI